MRRRARVLLTLACAVAACRADAHDVTLAVAGRTNEGVTLASRGDFVAAVWTAASADTTDVYAASSADGGATFGPPVRVNAIAGDARAGGEQPPQVVLGGGDPPAVSVVWTTKRAEGTRLLSAQSLDGGRTFSASTVVHGTDAAGNRGWESVAIDSAGRVMTAWLDHRNTAMAPGMMHHQADAAPAPKPDPVAKAGLSQLMFTTLAGTAEPVSVASSVCYCCKTALATAPGGRVFAAWRHVFPGNQRDIAFAMSRDNGATFTTPVRVSDDHWTFDGCPENGPAIAVDGAQHVHVVWPTPLDGTPESPMALFHAMSVDGGAFSPRTRVPTNGPAFHVRTVVAADGSLILAWEARAGTARSVRMARATVSGAQVEFHDVAIPGANAGGYPALALTRQGVVVAWVNWGDRATVIRVARASVR